DTATIFGPTLVPRQPAAPITPSEIRAAAGTALGKIVPALAKLPRDHVLAAIADDLRKLTQATDPILLGVNQALTRFLPTQLEQLRSVLGAQPVTLASLPPDLTRDWVLPDGRARIQVVPKSAARSTTGLAKFVDEVTVLAPEAGGSAVTIEATSATI